MTGLPLVPEVRRWRVASEALVLPNGCALLVQVERVRGEGAFRSLLLRDADARSFSGESCRWPAWAREASEAHSLEREADVVQTREGTRAWVLAEASALWRAAAS